MSGSETVGAVEAGDGNSQEPERGQLSVSYPPMLGGTGAGDRLEQAAFDDSHLVLQPEPGPISKRLVFLRPDWLPTALLFGDAVIAGASVLIAYWYRHNLDFINPAQGENLMFAPYLPAVPAVIAIYLFALWINKQYRSWRGRTLVDLLISMYSGIGLAAILILAAISLTNLGLDYSRLTITYTVVLTAVLMTGERFLLREYETRLRRLGVGTERVLVVGVGSSAELLVRRMSMFPQYGYLVTGVLDDSQQAGAAFCGVPVVGRVQDLPRLAREMAIEKCLIAVSGGQRDQLLQLIRLCEDQRIEFRLVPDVLELMSARADAESIDGIPLIGIRKRSRLTGRRAVLKRLVDLTITGIAMIVAAPLMLVLGAMIKLTSPGGPALFRQERVGRHRKVFTVYKFRTMIPNAEAQTGPKVAMPGDPRVTPVGRFLRKTSLDELPQLINVLKGDMSLVGPRPQPTHFDKQYSADVPGYSERQQVRPGVTGWAEVNDLRGAAPIVDRTLYDVYYVENWSLLLDLKIILLTAVRLFSQKHAY